MSNGNNCAKARPKKEKKALALPIGEAFVPILKREQESQAYIDLTGSAAKLYGYLKRAARVAASACRVGEREVQFDFTYTEAKRYGFSESTFLRAMKDLWAKGFIDVVQRGGLRGTGRTNSRYKLSGMWATYGKYTLLTKGAAPKTMTGWTDRTRVEDDPWGTPSEPKKTGDVSW